VEEDEANCSLTCEFVGIAGDSRSRFGKKGTPEPPTRTLVAQRVLHRQRRSIPEAGDDVAVDVQRNGDRGVPEHVGDYLRVDALD
jgi:hypothetical protein